MPFKLSATLSAHSSDVRAVVAPTENLVLSASRDSTAISWLRSSSVDPFSPSSVLRAGSRYVNAVAYISPSSEAPHGYAVVGGQDTVINIFALGSPHKEDPEYTLVAHTDNVCALDVTPQGTIISGSWDKTAKVWRDFQLQYDLKGHQQSVWAVLALDDQHFLTASADKTIKLWIQHKMVRTYQGHKDAVRGLAAIPDIGFASCSNDSEIRVWTMEGDTVHTLSGHSSFVYSLALLPSGDIVSGGEDRTVRVWRDGECVQTIVHPAISVWCVSAMPNGDIVSGCSDGVVRVFSESEDRWASAEDLSVYEGQVAHQALPSQQVGDVKKSDLPGVEALDTPGKKPGEVKMIRNGDNVEAHQWDSASYSWQKIGDVVDAVGSGRKQLYEGKEYDYVFDVDVQDGVPPLKLPYNVTENPYAAAQRFLERNELSLNYVDEVVRFIEKNTAGVSIGTGNNEFVDPYTGASRYQASASSAPSAPPSSYADPYTGASRYSGAPPTEIENPSNPASAPQLSSAPSSAPSSALKIIPLSKFVSFKQANLTAMQSKLYQFDDALRNEISMSSLAMYPEELMMIDEIFTWLFQAISSPTPPPLTLGPQHINIIIQIIDRWPAFYRFPVIDLSRLVSTYCADISTAPGEREKFFSCLFKASDWDDVASGKPLTKAQETNILLLFRTIATSFQEGTPIDEGSWVPEVFEWLGQASFDLLTKTQRVALATILFNFSCGHLERPVDVAVRDQHLNLVLNLLRTGDNDSEAVYRALVALGNVVYAAKTHNTPINSSQVEELKQLAAAMPNSFSDDRIKNVVGEVLQLL